MVSHWDAPQHIFVSCKIDLYEVETGHCAQHSVDWLIMFHDSSVHLPASPVSRFRDYLLSNEDNRTWSKECFLIKDQIPQNTHLKGWFHRAGGRDLRPRNGCNWISMRKHHHAERYHREYLSTNPNRRCSESTSHGPSSPNPHFMERISTHWNFLDQSMNMVEPP